MKYWALWALVQAGGRLPVRVAYALAAAAGTATWFLSRSIREVTRDHMRHVLGPGTSRTRVDALARACVRTNLYYYADFARFGLASLQGRDLLLFEAVDHTSGLEVLFDAHDEGRGVVMIGGHLGNGEVLARAAAPFGLCIGIMTERLSPPRVHEFVHRIRAAEGTPMFPADARGLRAALAHLKAGGSLGLLVDRDVLGTGEPLPFFGQRARQPTGAVE
ncbi:MAG: lysophospholipid acyltransferase family protein, partial [Dehalococcoidia bacterium]